MTPGLGGWLWGGYSRAFSARMLPPPSPKLSSYTCGLSGCKVLVAAACMATAVRASPLSAHQGPAAQAPPPAQAAAASGPPRCHPQALVTITAPFLACTAASFLLPFSRDHPMAPKPASTTIRVTPSPSLSAPDPSPTTSGVGRGRATLVTPAPRPMAPHRGELWPNQSLPQASVCCASRGAPGAGQKGHGGPDCGQSGDRAGPLPSPTPGQPSFSPPSRKRAVSSQPGLDLEVASVPPSVRPSGAPLRPHSGRPPSWAPSSLQLP